MTSGWSDKEILIGLVTGVTKVSCQLYERKDSLMRATICVFRCSSLLRRIEHSQFYMYTSCTVGFAVRLPINVANFSNWSIGCNTTAVSLTRIRHVSWYMV